MCLIDYLLKNINIIVVNLVQCILFSEQTHDAPDAINAPLNTHCTLNLEISHMVTSEILRLYSSSLDVCPYSLAIPYTDHQPYGLVQMW